MRIPFEFRLDKAWAALPFPSVQVEVWLRGKETRFGGGGASDWLALLDTGTDYCTLPKPWLLALGVWDDPHVVERRALRTIHGKSTVNLALWRLSLAINGFEVAEPVRFLFYGYPRGIGLPCAVLGQDLLQRFIMYHNPRLNTGWLQDKESLLSRLVSRI